MIRSIVKMSKKYFPKEQRSIEFIPFIEILDTDGFDRILKNIPPGIANREPDFESKAEKLLSLIRK